MASAAEIIRFWRDAGYKAWFTKDETFDGRCRGFEAEHHAAARGELAHWEQDAEGALALMILLDQYPRNSFRGTAHQFATDTLGLMFARQAWERDWPQTFEPDLRQFFVTPFEHSEALSDQDEAVSLSADMPEVLKYAKIHRDIIVRFGRFPHRNRCLGRETTLEEQAFLDEGGFAG